MTRIIAGRAKGRRLRTPPGDATRPTTDRVREALFSMLLSELGPLAGLRFLDLYAGSGAVGLEAVSRGAEATLVERDRRTAALVRDNAATARLEADVVARGVDAYLAQEPGKAFDVAFADPPYDLGEEALAAVLARLAQGWVAADGLVVVERSARSPQPRLPAGWSPGRSRSYGETVLHVLLPDSTGSGRTSHDGSVSP